MLPDAISDRGCDLPGPLQPGAEAFKKMTTKAHWKRMKRPTGESQPSGCSSTWDVPCTSWGRTQDAMDQYRRYLASSDGNADLRKSRAVSD